MNDNSNAKKNFELVVSEGKSGFLNKAIQKMAELSMDTKDPHKAVSFYLKLIETAANKKEISNAWNGLMLAYYEIKDYDSSSIYANSIIKNGATSITYTNRALLYLAKNALAEDDEKSVDYLLSCANSATDQYGAEAYYLLAQYYYSQKKYAQSLEFLFELNKSFSNYAKWLDRSFMLIADNYIAMNELYQAKATLISILENAKDPEIILQAKEKLEKLDPQ
jgi:tetratricopeptide (TPR) repeat protein